MAKEKWEVYLTDKKYQRIIIIISILFIFILAYANRFVQDDTFISLRYAENFANGHGLVYNIGETPVEGYTNFLWTIIMAFFFKIGIEPILATYIVNLAFFALSLYFIFLLTSYFFEEFWKRILTLLAIGTNYTFTCYATGGLETQMQTALFLIAVYITFKIISTEKYSRLYLFSLGVILSLALLTRLDSGIITVILGLTILFHLYKSQKSILGTIIRILPLALPMLFIVGSWLIWKVIYYGNILPNTFYLKVGGIKYSLIGLVYFLKFIKSYQLIIVFLVLVLFFKKIIKSKNKYLLISLIIYLSYIIYVIRVGGDFMEFRFLVPTMPFLFFILFWVIFNLLKSREAQALLIVLFFVGSMVHFITFHPRGFENIYSVDRLKTDLYIPSKDWIGIGKQLNKSFSDVEGFTVATTAAGAIPFYSKLRTVDMLGLNDSWIAKNGIIHLDRPAHTKVAPLEYLKKQKVSIAIGHLRIFDKYQKTFEKPIRTKKRFENVFQIHIGDYPVNQSMKLVEIWIEKPNRWLLALMLEDDPKIRQEIIKNSRTVINLPKFIFEK